MKTIQLLKSSGMAAVALLMAGAGMVFAQTPTTNLNSFSSGGGNSEGNSPAGCGNGYGAGSILWDNEGEPANIGLYPGTTGAGYVSVGYSADNTSAADEEWICFPGDGVYYYPAGAPTVDLANYSAVQFDVLWDTNNSNISIDNFNNPANIGFGANSFQGFQIDYSCESGGNNEGNMVESYGAPPLGSYFIQMPDAASNGWVQITAPIPNDQPYTSGFVGIILKYWLDDESNAVVNFEATNLNIAPQAYFWVANVNLVGTEGPPPPPILQAPYKPTPGLNVFASTSGIFDRQEVGLVASNGVSWVGHDLTSPVTYSFTINGFPQSPSTEAGYVSTTTTNNGGCEAYLMMSPNPNAYDNALDYNEPNIVIFNIQQGTNGMAYMTFQYKTNLPFSENLTTIGTLTSHASAVGTWSITFSSDTNVTIKAPDGTTGNYVFTNASSFAETADPGMYLYLGMQANNVGSVNQAVCYSQFSISGVPATVTDNFLTDSALSTNIWFNFMGHAPNGDFVMPQSAEDWVSWSVPYAGFQFQYSTNLLGQWTVLNDTNDVTLVEAGQVLQLITTNDIPAGARAAYFDMASP